MEQEKTSSSVTEKAFYRCEIPMKLPSCNTYINACRRNRFVGAKLKADTEDQIIIFLNKLPRIENPVKISFLWIEDSKRRDLDGITFGKKFILDALVKAGVLPDDSQKYVKAFTDSFDYAKEAKVILEIEEV